MSSAPCRTIFFDRFHSSFAALVFVLASAANSGCGSPSIMNGPVREAPPDLGFLPDESVAIDMQVAVAPGHPVSPLAMLTHHNDNQRTGANLHETKLTTAAVLHGFGKSFSRATDGIAHAQPLYVPGVEIAGKGTHNVVFVATQHNSVYAFDADDPKQSDPLWHVNFGPSVPTADLTGGASCNITPEVGITGTPVIDAVNYTLYVVAKTRETTNGAVTYQQHLHALDISTGSEKLGGPVAIEGSIAGTGDGAMQGMIAFEPLVQLQRSALLLDHGVIYVTFAGHCDAPPFHGWVFAFDSLTMKTLGVYNATPDQGGGGIWQSGEGPSADTSGDIYLMTGNGLYDGKRNLGDSILKLRAVGGTLNVMDSFTPFDAAARAATDSDLATSGVLVLPGTNLAIGGDKEGFLFVVDRSAMGGFQACAAPCATPDSQIVQRFKAIDPDYHSTSPNLTGIYGSPVFWEGPAGRLLYVWGDSDSLRAYQEMPDGHFNPKALFVGKLISVPGLQGGILSLSANGNTAGSGVLWVSRPVESPRGPGILEAYDAADITHKLWSSETNSSQDGVATFIKFAPPTVANGQVFLNSGSGELLVYGPR